MSKRLFFTCPLKAAYMAKEFDVKFTDEDGDKIFVHNNIAQGIWMWRWHDEPSAYYGGFPKKLPSGKIVEDIK